MPPQLAAFIFLVIVGAVLFWLLTSRKRQEKRLQQLPTTAAAAGMATTPSAFEAATGNRAPVAAFHVRGDEIQVTFDVPLSAETDDVLNDLLVDEAMEVVREKRHTLPIDAATVVVAFAGRDQVREVGRTKLPSPGELPPRMEHPGISLANVAHDPFATSFDETAEKVADLAVRAVTPEDELGPLAAELVLPAGLERGLRASGVDPTSADASELILALLRMFGYSVTEHTFPGSYVAVKDGRSTYIQAERHGAGESPEVSDAAIRRFLTDFNSSGAERGLLLSEKYAPFEIHTIEARQPKVRFVTRERVQRFIDSMALG